MVCESFEKIKYFNSEQTHSQRNHLVIYWVVDHKKLIGNHEIVTKSLCSSPSLSLFRLSILLAILAISLFIPYSFVLTLLSLSSITCNATCLLLSATEFATLF